MFTPTITITYTDGSTSEADLPMRSGERTLEAIDRFRERVRAEYDAYVAMGVKRFTFHTTANGGEVYDLHTIRPANPRFLGGS